MASPDRVEAPWFVLNHFKQHPAAAPLVFENGGGTEHRGQGEDWYAAIRSYVDQAIEAPAKFPYPDVGVG